MIYESFLHFRFIFAKLCLQLYLLTNSSLSGGSGEPVDESAKKTTVKQGNPMIDDEAIEDGKEDDDEEDNRSVQ